MKHVNVNIEISEVIYAAINNAELRRRIKSAIFFNVINKSRFV